MTRKAGAPRAAAYGLRLALAGEAFVATACSSDYLVGNVAPGECDKSEDAAVPSPRFQELEGLVSMEAEHYSEAQGYVQEANSEASGAAGMRATPDAAAGAARLAFRVRFSRPGVYHVWLRTFVRENVDNGVFLEMDGSLLQAPPDHPHAGVRDVYLRKDGWSWIPEWDPEPTAVHTGPVTMTITPGDHAFGIVKRKTGTPYVDKIVFSLADNPPVGLGPPETRDSTTCP